MFWKVLVLGRVFLNRKGRKDRYSGITVIEGNLPDVDAETFSNVLKASLVSWIGDGIRGAWVSVPKEKARFIPVLVEQQFNFHHAAPEYVMMNRWLPENEENKLPLDTNTSIGVGGFVLTQDNKLLVIKEQYYNKSPWKLPGGMVDHGEEIADAAIREVLEETNIKTEFVSIIAFRHAHNQIFDTSNLYIICRLKPLSTEITKDDREIADACWLPVEEYLADTSVTPLNREIAKVAMQNTTITNGKPEQREFAQVPMLRWDKKHMDNVFFCHTKP